MFLRSLTVGAMCSWGLRVTFLSNPDAAFFGLRTFLSARKRQLTYSFCCAVRGFVKCLSLNLIDSFAKLVVLF